MREEPDQRGTVSLQQPACGIGFCPLEENVKEKRKRVRMRREEEEKVMVVEGSGEMKVKGKGFIGEKKRCQVSRI